MHRVRSTAKSKKTVSPAISSTGQLLLDGYVPLDEAAQQPNMPSLRTLQRHAAMRCLDGLYIGRRPFLNIPRFRAGLEARVLKALTGKGAR